MRRNFERTVERANIVTSVGILLTVVPLGLILVSYVITSGASLIQKLVSLGWAFYVTIALLPLGLALFVFGLGWMVILKRAKQRGEFDADEDEEESAPTQG
ncbi:MAG: hypothetical protein HC904_15765 [Blastochloris sp.]|nr:hypothetical protein [Blastochloris sp.]